MGMVRTMVDTITDAESAMKVMMDVAALDHASTSKAESKKLIMDKAASLGLRYSMSAQNFIKVQGEG